MYSVDPATEVKFPMDRMDGGPKILSRAECLIKDTSLLAVHSYKGEKEREIWVKKKKKYESEREKKSEREWKKEEEEFSGREKYFLLRMGVNEWREK